LIFRSTRPASNHTSGIFVKRVRDIRGHVATSEFRLDARRKEERKQQRRSNVRRMQLETHFQRIESILLIPTRSYTCGVRELRKFSHFAFFAFYRRDDIAKICKIRESPEFPAMFRIFDLLFT
jgi:hypothetical protein